jgi:uncharacterized protein YjiK
MVVSRLTPAGLIALLALLLVPKASTAPKVAAAPGDAFVRQAQVLEAERTGLAAPAGLAFSSSSGAFYVTEAGPAVAETEVVRLNPFRFSPQSDRAGQARIQAAVRDPINLAFDPRGSRLLLLDQADRLLEVRLDANGDLDPRTLVRRDALRLELPDPQGMSVDPATGMVFILDAAQPRLVRVVPAADGSFEQATVSEIDLRASGLSSPRGLAFDPASGHLQVGGGGKLSELSASGELLAVRDLSEFVLASPQGMSFAPSGDQTDDPAQLSLYLADAGGRPAGSAQTAPSSGQIVELSLVAPPAAEAIDFTASLVRTIDTATWTPPSPDPSGLTYLPPPANTLLVTDGEVEETVSGITHFLGVNVWESTLLGAVVVTANISRVGYPPGNPPPVPMTNEPTGVTWRPSNGHYFVTQDDGDTVYDLNPGGDGEIGTTDDSWTSFITTGSDPEGIAYDTLGDRLFVCDGTNAEIYEYTPGGSLQSHFDVLGYGVVDPETVEYNPESDTLFVLSNRRSGPNLNIPIIIEVTKSGALLQTIEVSEADERRPAGLAYAPASDGSGVKHFYWADREVDNNSNPNIVDGKIFEFTAPPTGPGDDPPAVSLTSPANGAEVTGTAVSVEASASDDNGVTQVEFFLDGSTSLGTDTSSPYSVSWNTTTTTDGAHSLTARATDTASQTTTSAAVNVTVNNSGGGASPLYFSLRAKGTVGGLTAANEDIIFFDGTASFSLAFDGSDVGLASSRLDAFSWLDADSLLLSLDADGAVLNGITVDDSDILRFDASSLGTTTTGTFTLYFDGSDVGLTTNAHDVDAVELLGDGRILISTRGKVVVQNVPAGRDEDLLAFTPTSLGGDTAGTFAMHFEGSDVGLLDSTEDVDAAAVEANGDIYLSTTGVFSVTGVSGDDEDVFIFQPTSTGNTTTGSYLPTLYFDGSAFQLAATNDVFAIDLP